jgi:hypothetical protein
MRLSSSARRWKNVARAVLRRPHRASGADQVEGVAHDRSDEPDRTVEEVGDGVSGADRDGPLEQDVAGVEFGVHAVRGDPDLLLVVDERPDEGREAGVCGKQRVVHVEGAVRGQVEDLRRDPRTPVVGDDDVGLCLFEPVHQVGVGAVGDGGRDAVFGGEVGDGVAPDLLVRVLALRMRHHEGDVMLGFEQRFERAVTPGLVAEHGDPHHCLLVGEMGTSYASELRKA